LLFLVAMAAGMYVAPPIRRKIEIRSTQLKEI
jgi:hypothetical protein